MEFPPVYIQEIVKNKAELNGLPAHHPNLVMANWLGKDAQFALIHAERPPLTPST